MTINGVSIKVLSGLRKVEVKVKDLGKLQAVTGDEYTLLRGNRGRVLICGISNQIGIPDEYVKKYKWCAHSHPSDTSPSQPDRDALRAFGQESSVIVSAKWKLKDPIYKPQCFEQFEDLSTWLPS